MKRSIWAIPAGTTLDTLTPEQQEAIAAVYSQFVLPMPGTVEHDGMILVDGITADNFDPDVMPGLGLDWTCLGMWQWDGHGDVVTLVPLDMGALYPHLPDVIEYDEDGNVTGTSPAERRLPHGWSGWPVVG